MNAAPQAGKIPLPRPTELSQPHWDGCKEGKLRVQRCGDCAAYVFIPQVQCTSCYSLKLSWVEASGRGTIYSYTTVHRPQRLEFEVPYTVAIVELEEGWHMLSNVIGCAHEDIEVGMAVEVTYVKRSDEITLPMFRPAA